MARRTIAAATAELNDLSRGLNPAAYRDLDAEVAAARQAAETFSHSIADSMARDITDAREEVLRELCDIRDGFDELTKRGGSSLMTAADYHDQWDALAARQRAAERRLDEFAQRLDTIQAIEDDPVGYADRFYENTPNLMPEFTF